MKLITILIAVVLIIPLSFALRFLDNTIIKALWGTAYLSVISSLWEFSDNYSKKKTQYLSVSIIATIVSFAAIVTIFNNSVKGDTNNEASFEAPINRKIKKENKLKESKKKIEKPSTPKKEKRKNAFKVEPLSKHILESGLKKLNFFTEGSFAFFIDSIYTIKNNEKIILTTIKTDGCASKTGFVGDFNKDGFEDLIIEIIPSCGGNSTSAVFWQFFLQKENSILKSDLLVDVEVISINGDYYFKSYGDELVLPKKYSELYSPIIEYYTFVGDEMKLFKEEKNFPLKTKAEINITDFDSYDKTKPILNYQLDFDNDGIADTIICNYNQWGRYPAYLDEQSIHFGNKKRVILNYNLFRNPLRRIGVLESEQLGVNDIVINVNEVWRWNGESYIQE